MSTDTLIEMLSYRRPAGSHTEREFIDRFITPLNPEVDTYGNQWVEVGASPILWSSHTDTVHHYPGRQGVVIANDIATLVKPKVGTCLGADCGTGVWLMTEMIKAQVPGLYIFHREEETGGHGSSFIAKNHAEYLSHIRYAIAFDRKKTRSIITHQGTRTCSDEFADSLGAILGDFEKDDTGTFTDTANYTDIIGECTNVSVGYYDQHLPTERQDLAFASSLLNTLLTADFSTLVQRREPGDVDFEDRWWSNYTARKPVGGFADMDDFVKSYPYSVSSFLEECGYTIDDLQEYQDQMYGGRRKLG